MSIDTGKDRAFVQFRDLRISSMLSERTTRDLSKGLIAKRDLERYYDILDHTLASLDLSMLDAQIVCNVIGATDFEEADKTRLLWAEVELYMESRAIVNPGLVAKLKTLEPEERYALIDACERALILGGTTPPTLASVGLVAHSS